MAQVSRTREAEADLLEIWTHIAEDNMEAADKVIRNITRKCQVCAEMPEMGRQRDEIVPGFRSIVEGKYVIFYQLREDGVQVMRVLHSARDIPSLFD